MQQAEHSGIILLCDIYIYNLVGGLEHVDYFPYIGNVIIPTDELIFFRDVGQPPTSNSIMPSNSPVSLV